MRDGAFMTRGAILVVVKKIRMEGFKGNEEIDR